MQMKLDEKPNIDQTSQNQTSEVEVASENEIFVNESNDIKQENDPLSKTENKIEFSTNLKDNPEEFSNEFSNDIELNKDSETHFKEDGQIESVDTKNAFECKICLTNFSISTELDVHQKTYTEETSFQCKTCLKYSKSFLDSKCHEKSHKVERKFQRRGIH